MRRLLVALPLVVGLAGCGGDNNSPTSPGDTTPTIAVVVATSNPSLVSAAVSPNPAYSWQISWVLDLQETAGIAGTLDFLQVTIADRQVLVLSAAGIKAAAGSNSLAAKGSLNIPLTLLYTLPDGGKLANVTTSINFTDSKGNVIVTSAQLRIVN
jgi:ABC-type glycerol-3-phosphate transport system substrate-binding protein